MNVLANRCDWYDNGTAPRCSGFYHDQEQTPEHPGGGAPYRVDGDCIEQCDCGGVNPCAEYIFDHRGAKQSLEFSQFLPCV
jgi:hypothetical protein